LTPSDFIGIASVVIALLTFISTQMESIRLARNSARKVEEIRNGVGALRRKENPLDEDRKVMLIEETRELTRYLRHLVSLAHYRIMAEVMAVLIAGRALALYFNPGVESSLPEYVYGTAIVAVLALYVRGMRRRLKQESEEED
jgi:hypothetical protein